MSLHESRSSMRGRATWPALFALAGLLGAFVAHVAAGLSLGASIRIGSATMGMAALCVALRLLIALGEERGGETMGGAHVEPFTASVIAWLRRARSPRRAVVVGPAALELLVTLGERSAADFHARLRPRLRAVVLERLLLAGIDPADPEAVGRRLGPTGVLVVTDTASVRPPRDEPGVPASAVRDLLRRLDSLA